MAPFIHATADVADSAQIGEGTKIWHQGQIRPGVHIGKNCILGKGVFVDENVKIGNYVKIQNYVSVFHGVTIEDGVFVGPHVFLPTTCARARSMRTARPNQRMIGWFPRHW
jgi:UDP-3-O-[3-hydroxymyristoyl] glucosamine N-acyltransferase